MVEEIV
jgi:hypothetical protein